MFNKEIKLYKRIKELDYKIKRITNNEKLYYNPYEMGGEYVFDTAEGRRNFYINEQADKDAYRMGYYDLGGETLFDFYVYKDHVEIITPHFNRNKASKISAKGINEAIMEIESCVNSYYYEEIQDEEFHHKQEEKLANA